PRRRQHDRPEQLAEEERRVPPLLPELLARGREEGTHVRQEKVHSRRARPVSERNTSSRVTGTTSTWRMVVPVDRAASNAAGTKSRADAQCAVTVRVPLRRS